MLRLALLADCTAFHHHLYVFIDVWPVHRHAHEQSGFLNSEVSFVQLVQNVTSQCIGYDDLFSFEDDATRNADFIAIGPVRTKILWKILDCIRPSAVDCSVQSAQCGVSTVDISRSCTRLLMLKCIMSMLHAFSSSTSSVMSSTVMSNGISAFFSGLGSLERTSAIIICLPGRYTS